jgi:hypothetical protein
MRWNTDSIPIELIHSGQTPRSYIALTTFSRSARSTDENRRRPEEDERELAGAILEGSKRRTDQACGDYYRGRNSSCALGVAYEGIYRLPDTAAGRADRAFERRASLDARTHRGVGRRPRRAARRITRPSLMGHFR